MSILIGVTTYGRNENDEFHLPAKYVDAVRRAGGTPVLLPPDEAVDEDILSHLDGLILAGGGDIDPANYGGSQHETIYMVDAERDKCELALARAMVASKTPALCICRGSQVLNVALGGTLIEHLPDEVDDTVLHRLPPRLPGPHPVLIEPGARLASLFDTLQIEIASWHHQAIRRVAEPLVVAARAPDGVIEAVEHPDHPWLVAVQWHPEITAAKDPKQQKLFDELVKAAAERKSRK